MVGTFWAFIPAIIAIILALITKQVYVSLFLGIFVGAMMYTGGDPLNALFTLFNVMSEKVGANVSIIVFLVVLGILVVLMQKSVVVQDQVLSRLEISPCTVKRRDSFQNHTFDQACGEQKSF
jgi:Na+/H+ antiporter NhaC